MFLGTYLISLVTIKVVGKYLKKFVSRYRFQFVYLPTYNCVTIISGQLSVRFNGK